MSALVPVPAGGGWLAPRQDGGPPTVVPDDYRYLEDIVRIGYPVREARSYLARHLGNPVSYRLVEARRGETVGVVREVEVLPRGDGDPVYVRTRRMLPDGSPASYYVPPEMVEVRTVVEAEGGHAIPPLGPGDRVLLHVPVRSYLRFLPGIYRGASPSQRRDVTAVTERSARQWGARDEVKSSAVTVHQTDQFQRFLFLFQHLMTTVTDKIDQIPSLTDPLTADPRFLPWIASWVSFELNEALPLHQQRELVRRSIRLYRTRGTVEGVTEMIRVLTTADVEIVERCAPRTATLGSRGLTLVRGRNVAERYRHGDPAPAFLQRPGRKPTTFFVVLLKEDRKAFQARFGERAEVELRRISQIVSNEMPAHVTFTIEFEERLP